MEMQVPFKMEKPNFEILIHGFDTVQCAYSMEQRRKGGIDFQFLREKKESIRELKSKEPRLQGGALRPLKQF